MERASRWNMVTLAVGVSILWATVTSAGIFSPYLYGPPVVRFVGTFQPVEQQDAGALNTLTISLQNQKWLYHITRVDTLTGTDPGMMLLNNIFPPQLHFFGPPKLLAPLEGSDAAGKQVTVEGFLYIGDRSFYVTSAHVAA